jgi:hypothetical protein
MALALTVVLAVSIPFAAWGVATTGEQLARVERAARTLEEIGPEAADVAATLAEVSRRLADLGEQYGPALTQVSDGVADVTGNLQGLTDELRPLASTLGIVSEALRGETGGNDVADALTTVQQAIRGVSDAVDGVAARSADVAGQVRVLTSPETLAMLDSAANAVDSVAVLSDRAAGFAGGYVDHAGAIAAAAWVLVAASLLGSVGWLAWRVREHHRWQLLRAARAADAVLAAVPRR